MKKFVFFGTPDYVVPIIQKLERAFPSGNKGGGLQAVVTQPPRAAGRSQKIEYSPVDKWAHKKGIPVYYDMQKLVQEIQVPFGVLAAYGAIVPKSVIDHFPEGILNIHPSLLPKYRGASPVQAAIASGDMETGVSVIKLDERMDHGPIISSFKEGIEDKDTSQLLRQSLFQKAADFLVDLLPAYLEGKVKLKSQDHDRATYTSLVKKEDGFIPPKILQKVLDGSTSKKPWKIGFIKDFSLKASPKTVERFIRALQPWPGAWTNVHLGKNEVRRLKILKAELNKEKLLLDLVQLEGKNPVSWQQLQEGYPKLILE